MKDKLIELLKEIAFFAINWLRKLICLVCLCFPIKKNDVFVNYFDGKGIGDHPKYIIRELIKKDPTIKVYWVYRGKEKSNVENIEFVKPFSISAIFYQTTSKIWVSSVRMPYYSIKRKNQYYFQTWHGGLAFKRIEQECEDALSRRYKRTCRHDSKMIDYWVSSNADNTKLYKDYFWYQGGEIMEVGSPRNDIFFSGDNSELKVKIRNQYNLGGNKVVMYAPTFRKKDSFKAYNLNLNTLCECLEKKFGGKWKLIVRLHPRLAKDSEKFIEYSDTIIDGSKIDDIQELLSITDLLITDYSSIALDFMNARRAVVIYASDIDDYKKDRDFHMELESTPFPIATNQTELEEAIDNFEYEKYRESLDAFMKKYDFFDNGHASEKVAGKIYTLMQKC